MLAPCPTSSLLWSGSAAWCQEKGWAGVEGGQLTAGVGWRSSSIRAVWGLRCW